MTTTVSAIMVRCLVLHLFLPDSMNQKHKRWRVGFAHPPICFIMYNYIIGDVPVTIACIKTKLKQDNFTELFINDSTNGRGFIFEEHILDESNFKNAEVLEKTGGYELLKTDRGMFIMNHWAKLRYGYGFYVNDLKLDKPLPVYFNEKINDQHPLSVDRFLSSIGLHGMYLRSGGAIIHGSYIISNGKAIIFTAPAQTGKSTQADLWKNFADARIINGDRVLLMPHNDEWTAYGYPCCGSSLICENVTAKLAAVVVLSQGKENLAEKLTLPRAVRALVSATELYPWHKEEVDLAFERAMSISTSVPVIGFSCLPDKSAVDTLKNYLEGIGIWN